MNGDIVLGKLGRIWKDTSLFLCARFFFMFDKFYQMFAVIFKLNEIHLHSVFLSEDGLRLVEGFARGLLYISWSSISGTLCLCCNFKDFRGKDSVFGGVVALYFFHPTLSLMHLNILLGALCQHRRINCDEIGVNFLKDCWKFTFFIVFYLCVLFLSFFTFWFMFFCLGLCIRGLYARWSPKPHFFRANLILVPSETTAGTAVNHVWSSAIFSSLNLVFGSQRSETPYFFGIVLIIMFAPIVPNVERSRSSKYPSTQTHSPLQKIVSVLLPPLLNRRIRKKVCFDNQAFSKYEAPASLMIMWPLMGVCVCWPWVFESIQM